MVQLPDTNLQSTDVPVYSDENLAHCSIDESHPKTLKASGISAQLAHHCVCCHCHGRVSSESVETRKIFQVVLVGSKNRMAVSLAKLHSHEAGCSRWDVHERPAAWSCSAEASALEGCRRGGGVRLNVVCRTTSHKPPSPPSRTGPQLA